MMEDRIAFETELIRLQGLKDASAEKAITKGLMEDTGFYDATKGTIGVPDGVDPTTIHSYAELKKAITGAGGSVEELNGFIADTTTKAVTATKGMTEFKNTVARLEKQGKVMDGMASTLSDIEKGGLKSSKALKKLREDVSKLGRAHDAMNFATSDGVKDAKLLEEAYEDIGKVIGWTAEEIAANLPAAMAE